MSDQFAARLAILEPSYRDAWAVRPLVGKVSRKIARSVRAKRLEMRNTVPLVTFSFDDVAASACVVGAPLLERHGGRGTFYVAGAGCGAASPCGPLATMGQIRELHRRGHEIGCHTYSHVAVSRLPIRDLIEDLDRSARFLSDVCDGADVQSFAYPYGDYSWRSKQLIQSHSASCRSVIPGVNAGTVDLGLLKSVSLEDASIDRAGIVPLLDETVRLCGWLIFSSHDVEERPSRYGVSPGLLEFAVKTANAKGCRVTTTVGALRLAKGQPASELGRS